MSAEILDTITVGSYFGDKEVTHDEFVAQWVDHGKQFANLNFEFYQSIMAEIEKTASDEWCRIFNKNNP